MKTIAKFWIAGFLLLACLRLPAIAYSSDNLFREFQNFAAPELLDPVTDNIDLRGKPALEFRWKKTDIVNTNRYIFKLYKGYSAMGSQLVRRRDIYAAEQVIIPAQEFETGKTYTWTLQQVFFNGKKSDIASGSFKVIAK
jgi:hypothetical protein